MNQHHADVGGKLSHLLVANAVRHAVGRVPSRRNMVVCCEQWIPALGVVQRCDERCRGGRRVEGLKTAGEHGRGCLVCIENNDGSITYCHYIFCCISIMCV